MTSIFAGFIFVFFHITINGVDFLPNFVGYLLITGGLGLLLEESPRFAKARTAAQILSAYSAVVWIAELFHVSMDHMAIVLLGAAANLYGLYVSYQISTGIRDIEQTKRLQLGAERLINAWKIQAAAQVTAICVWFPFMMTQLLALLALFVWIVATIAFLVFFYKAKTTYLDDLKASGE